MREYDLVIAVIESKFESHLIAEFKALLLAHESRILESQKRIIISSPSINYTQDPSSNLNPYQNNNFSFDSYFVPNNSYGFDFDQSHNSNPNPGGGIGGGGGRCNNIRGHGGRYSNF